MNLLLHLITLLLVQGLWAQSDQGAFTLLPDVGPKSTSMEVQDTDLDKYDNPDIVLVNEFQPNTKAIASSSHQGAIQTIPLHLFPNPSYGQLIVEGVIPNKASFTLLSPISKEVVQLFPKSISTEQYRLFAERTDLAFLSPGLYYVCVENDRIQCIPWLKE